ncbi:MAG: homoserine dehydrogenase [Candidatus Marinimicrobia bacterium]|nr:homoserine dehydrogenase [Candidatus Neomarinimicrobiota bacterium]
MKTFGVGILGFGTVGAGVVEGLQRNGKLLASRTGLQLALRRVADLDVETDRGVAVADGVLTRDAAAVVDDPRVDIVVELIGGTTVARALTLRALAAGKPVVTANKALLAEHGAEIFAAAQAGQADLYYEASVAGGIPVIRALREGLIANHIEAIYGILNGTCNYILTEMERRGEPFDVILAEAQAQGYAEANPALDIDGVDTAHKAAILAGLAYGAPVPLAEIGVEGIRDVELADLLDVRALGYRLKLLAIIRHSPVGQEVSVQPALVPSEHMLGKVDGVFNALLVRGDVAGETLYYGRGAGRLPTASAVLSDLADVARNLAFGARQRVPAFVPHTHYGKPRRGKHALARFYLRMNLPDQPGTLAKVAEVMGQHGISLASVRQRETDGQWARILFLTHPAVESAVMAAITELRRDGKIGPQVARYRIADLMA